MSEAYYAVYLKKFDKTVEDRVRDYHRHHYGRRATLYQKIQGAAHFDDDMPVTIVTVVE